MDDTDTPPDTREQADGPTAAACRLVATNEDGDEVDWAGLVHAVYDGVEDPDGFYVRLVAA